jgi:hypothetical protein
LGAGIESVPSRRLRLLQLLHALLDLRYAGIV